MQPNIGPQYSRWVTKCKEHEMEIKAWLWALWTHHVQHVPIYLNRFSIAEPKSSKVHHFSTFKTHFGLPAPETIAVNVTWMEREFSACQTPRSMYTSIFNRFPVIQAINLIVRHFSTFFAHFGLPYVCPWDNCGKCHTVGRRIQCL